MAGKNISKSTAPGYGKAAASTKGVKVGVNDSNVKLNVPSMKKGGMVGKSKVKKYQMGGTSDTTWKKFEKYAETPKPTSGRKYPSGDLNPSSPNYKGPKGKPGDMFQPIPNYKGRMMKKGGMVGKTASLAKAKKSGSMIKGKK